MPLEEGLETSVEDSTENWVNMIWAGEGSAASSNHFTLSVHHECLLPFCRPTSNKTYSNSWAEWAITHILTQSLQAFTSTDSFESMAH